ncbi:MAG: hypothetical protein ACYCOU_10005 [Sulfobacillus sp.]
MNGTFQVGKRINSTAGINPTGLLSDIGLKGNYPLVCEKDCPCYYYADLETFLDDLIANSSDLDLSQFHFQSQFR